MSLREWNFSIELLCLTMYFPVLYFSIQTKTSHRMNLLAAPKEEGEDEEEEKEEEEEGRRGRGGREEEDML